MADVVNNGAIDKTKWGVEADKLKFRPSIYGILIKEGRVLLSKQWDGYDLPGGGVEINETIEEAIKREFFEETGLEVEMISPIHCESSFYVPHHSKHQDDRWNCILMYYVVRHVGGELSTDNLDESEKEYVKLAEWISLDDLDKIKFYCSVDAKKIIRRAALVK